MTEILEWTVLLRGEAVGSLRYDAESVAFRFNDDYLRKSNRNVLGQVFEDDLRKEHRVRAGVPPWFSNLLPEGPLRELVARTAGVHPSREFFLLRHLGKDLPGAVEVIGHSDLGLGDAVPEMEPSSSGAAGEESDYQLKFSLAGVQLKFSVMKGERGVTIPIHGEHGDYIAKLPDERHHGVAENEFSMMTWAGDGGIEVPEFSLLDSSAIENFPLEVIGSGEKAFLIRRFDRSPGGRIHIEDFAQVLNRYPTPEGKYGGANYESVARIVLSLGGRNDLDEFVRRLVAIVAMGNGDAHLKNWSLIYEDGRTARLAPAYDLVSTVTYVKTAETLALNFAGSKSFMDVNMGSFRRLARKLDLPSETELDDTVRDTVERLQASWPSIRETMPFREEVRRSIDYRLRQLPLMMER